jgi:hypothetical protein
VLFATLLLVTSGSLQEEPEAPAWPDFPVFVWREDAGQPAPPGSLEPFGGVLLLRAEDGSWARERGLTALLWNGAGRDALHLDADGSWSARVERWRTGRAAEFLIRSPCLSDPDTRSRLEATLDATLAHHAGSGALGLVLGDEVALTPASAPFDLCRSPACEAAWRSWAAPRGWPEEAPTTDQARHAVGARDGRVVGAWLARRRFDRERLTALLQGLVQRSRAAGLAPALLGHGGTTAFGALDLVAIEDLEWSEGYPRLDARVLARRAAPRRLTTLFLAEESPDGAAWSVFDAWARGDAGLVLWSDRALTDTARRARLVEALAAVRSLNARTELAGVSPPVEVAFLHDPDAIAAGWLLEHAGDRDWMRAPPSHERRTSAFGRKIERWQDALARRGRVPTAVTLGPEDAPRRAALRLLVLVEPVVLDAADAEVLERFLEQGGSLVVDGRLGWIDRRGARSDVDWIARLRARAPGRVHVRDSDALGLESRWLEELERSAGLEPLPMPHWNGPEGRLAWRCAASRLPGIRERWQLVLWPDLATPRERRRLAPLELDLRAPEGWTLEPVHPPAPSGAAPVLRPGDAAVLLLERGAAD